PAPPWSRAAAPLRPSSRPCLSSSERAQRRGGAAPVAADELAIVVVGDLSRSVVELELFQCGERAVARLPEPQRSSSQFVRLRERVVTRSGLAQERDGHEDDRK